MVCTPPNSCWKCWALNDEGDILHWFPKRFLGTFFFFNPWFYICSSFLAWDTVKILWEGEKEDISDGKNWQQRLTTSVVPFFPQTRELSSLSVWICFFWGQVRRSEVRMVFCWANAVSLWDTSDVWTRWVSTSELLNSKTFQKRQ